jgi:tRNA modification GTPase
MQRAFDSMRLEILQAAALVEALIDFGEDQGIDDNVWYQGQCRFAASLALDMF